MASKSGSKKGAVKKPARRSAPVAATGKPAEVPIITREASKPVEMPVIEEVVPSAPAEAPNPYGQGVWARLRNVVGPRRDSLPEHLAAVKAGVLHELETLGIEKGVALQGGPFRSVVLPTIRKRRRFGWPVVAVAAVVLAFGVMWLVGRGPEEPGVVLARALDAVRTHDVAAFDEYVDVAGVASSVVNQLFTTPRLNTAALPADMRRELEGEGVAARMTAFIKPGLADALKDDMLAAVARGVVSNDEKSLLGKIWREMGGDKVRLGTARVAMQDTRMAVAEVPVARDDLALVLPLQVVLAHGAADPDAWEIVDMPNLAALLEGIARAESARDAARAATPVDVAVGNIRKARGNGGLLVTMMVANHGSEDVRNVRVRVSFGDAAGQPMKTAEVVVDGVLRAGASREQTWTVPVDMGRAAERYVAELPLSALSVTATAIK